MALPILERDKVFSNESTSCNASLPKTFEIIIPQTSNNIFNIMSLPIKKIG